jgi:hypothetical protein
MAGDHDTLIASIKNRLWPTKLEYYLPKTMSGRNSVICGM